MSISSQTLGRLRSAALTAVVFALGAGGALLVAGARERAGTPISRAFPFDRGDSTRLRAFVVLSASDCSGNLGFLALFQRDTLHVRLSRLYLVGPRSGLESTTALLRKNGITTPLVPVTPAVERALRELGALGTPFLVILDADGVVRLAMTSPPDVDTYMGFPKLLNELWLQGVSDPLVVR